MKVKDLICILEGMDKEKNIKLCSEIFNVFNEEDIEYLESDINQVLEGVYNVELYK